MLAFVLIVKWADNDGSTLSYEHTTDIGYVCT